MPVQPYLSFDGRCEEALEFYKTVLGAEVTMLMRFKDNPTSSGTVPSGSEDKILHSSFTVGDSTLMASDGHCGGEPVFRGIALSITVADDAGADRIFNGLADGGQVQVPLSRTFFSPSFGMVADRFGVSWMVYVQG